MWRLVHKQEHIIFVHELKVWFPLLIEASIHHLCKMFYQTVTKAGKRVTCANSKHVGRKS
jgi:hypothetical protein